MNIRVSRCGDCQMFTQLSHFDSFLDFFKLPERRQRKTTVFVVALNALMIEFCYAHHLIPSGTNKCWGRRKKNRRVMSSIELITMALNQCHLRTFDRLIITFFPLQIELTVYTHQHKCKQHLFAHIHSQCKSEKFNCISAISSWLGLLWLNVDFCNETKLSSMPKENTADKCVQLMQ